MKKYLRCFKNGLDITAGSHYEIIEEEDGRFGFVDDVGDLHFWPIDPDEEGESYRDHFTLEMGEDSAPITVIPDESLGGTRSGVLREYREVKRKADVGETVRVFGYARSRANGTFKVTKIINENDGYGDTIQYDIGGGDIYGTPYHDGKAYVVLEQSDIVRIGGARFRMIDRKAAVGERVVITKGNVAFKVGDVITVHLGGISYLDGKFGTFGGGDYRVLEPVGPAPTPPLSEMSTEDQYAENITVLVRKIAQLEDRVEALEAAQSPRVETVASVNATLIEKAKEARERRAARKTPQQQLRPSRDEIVERAKADVKRLTESAYDRMRTSPVVRNFGHLTVEFIVNRDKRTVVAIAKERYAGQRVVARGIAKCAPGETFNSHIGRAIALRRALRLSVPAEYLNAPKPEEVRVGDVTEDGVVYAVRPTHRTVGVQHPQAFVSSDAGYTVIDASGYEYWTLIKNAVILDDSRESLAGSTEGAAA